MKSTGKQGAGKRLNDIQRLEIISKLQQSNPPSKRAIAREYNIGESAIRKLWNQRELVLQRVQDIPDSSRASVCRRTQAWFPELEDRLYKWIDAMRRLKLELPPTLVIAKAREISNILNIAEEDFKASWGWLANFRARKGLGSILLYGEEAEIDKESPELLSRLNRLYDVIRQYPAQSVYNMDETGLFFRLLTQYTLLMPNEDISTVRGKKKSKDRVTLVVCANADGSNKIPCTIIGKSRNPSCIVGKTWPIPYLHQRKAWMDQPTCQQWFDTVFVPAVRKHTGRPVLLLLDNAPGHFVSPFERNGIRVEFFPPNCTSWKQPCDQGIIQALKTRYKFLYLRNVLSFYDLCESERAALKAQGGMIRRGSAGVRFGNPAHLLDAAKYLCTMPLIGLKFLKW